MLLLDEQETHRRDQTRSEKTDPREGIWGGSVVFGPFGVFEPFCREGFGALLEGW